MPVVPALVLDIDGTVIRNKNGDTFINKAEEVELFPGVEDKIWQYKNEGYLIIALSNQGGVAHGYQTVPETDAKFQAMIDQFEKNPFDLIKWSIFDAAGTVYPYNIRSLGRKPSYGLLAIAEMELFELGYLVDWDHSLFVGDRLEDAECALNAQIPFEHADRFFERDPPPAPALGESAGNGEVY